MPYKKTPMPEGFDRRIKIPKTEHTNIKLLHKNGMAIRAIARLYNVNKRLIQFILFPDRNKINLQHREERGGSKQYYDKDKWRVVHREHRRYKSTVLGINKRDYGYVV